MTTYRLLFADREFRALWTSSALSVAASTTAGLALAVGVHERTGSALLSALAMFGPSTVQVLGATTLMSAADTSPPRRALTAVGALSTTVLVLQAALPLGTAGRLALLLGGAYVLSVGSGVRWGLLSEVVPAERFALARSAMNVAVGAFQIVGFATGGLLLGLLTTGQVFAVAALLSAVAVLVLRTGVRERPPRRTARPGLRETARGNRLLLAGRDTRVLLLALCVPTGLVVGCEALFVPYAGAAAGWLLAAAAAGMLTGDLVVGRFLTAAGRRRASTPLRFLLATPFVPFALEPDLPVAVALAAAACVGYAASLAQQEWLLALTPRALRGQVLGTESSTRTTCQGLGAVLAGTLADLASPGLAMTLLALASLLASAALTRPLARAATAATLPLPGPAASR